MRIKKKNINNLLREIGSFIPVQDDATGGEIQTLGGDFSQLSQEELQKMQADNPRIIVEGANVAQNLMRPVEVNPQQTFSNPQATQPFFNPSAMRENPNNFGSSPQLINRPNNFSSPQTVNPLFRPVQFGLPTQTGETDSVNYGYGRVMDNQPLPTNETTSQMGTPQQLQTQAESQAIGQAQTQSTAVNKPRTSADIQAERDDLKNAPIERESSFMKRLGSGLLNAYINWGKNGGQGGIGGLVGNLAAGGIGSASSPYFLGQWKKNIKDDRLMREQAQVQQQEEFEVNKKLKDAQANEVIRRPEKEEAERQSKFELESQKQLNRLARLQEERRLKGLDTAIVTSKDGSGRLATRDANGKETLIVNPDGSYEYNLLERPEAVQIEDGKNADGTPKYRTVYTKGSQVVTSKATEDYRNAVLALNQNKFDYQKEKDTEDREEQRRQFNMKFNADLAKSLRDFDYKLEEDAKKAAEQGITNNNKEATRKTSLEKWKIEKLNALEKLKQDGVFGKGSKFNADAYEDAKTAINGVK